MKANLSPENRERHIEAFWKLFPDSLKDSIHVHAARAEGFLTHAESVEQELILLRTVASKAKETLDLYQGIGSEIQVDDSMKLLKSTLQELEKEKASA